MRFFYCCVFGFEICVGCWWWIGVCVGGEVFGDVGDVVFEWDLMSRRVMGDNVCFGVDYVEDDIGGEVLVEFGELNVYIFERFCIGNRVIENICVCVLVVKF